MTRYLTSRRLTLCLAALILWGTLFKAPGELPAHWLSDKALHAIAFAVLVFPRTVRKPDRWWRYAGMALALGAAIEVIQPTFGRSAEWGDLIADGVGVAVGVLAALVVRYVARGISRPPSSGRV